MGNQNELLRQSRWVPQYDWASKIDPVETAGSLAFAGECAWEAGVAFLRGDLPFLTSPEVIVVDFLNDRVVVKPRPEEERAAQEWTQPL